MLRLSRLADYGVMVMAHVAASPNAVHNAEAAAAATGLPGPTVAKLLAKLSRAGLLHSQRGARGGYRLARAPEAVSVADIVAALDGPIALTQCSEHQPSACDRENLCVSRRCNRSAWLNWCARITTSCCRRCRVRRLPAPVDQ